jgi:hypothetical protein
MKPLNLILSWLDPRLDPAAAGWLRAQCDALAADAPDRVLHLAFGQVVRKNGAAGHASLAATASEQAAAFAMHPGWNLTGWTVDQAARAALLLALPRSEKTVRAVLALFQTADLGEHIALARALFLMPNAPELLHIAREGIRSNMGDVFQAISQRNPYPSTHFDDIAWNQMVTKCLFVELPLDGIYGIDARANADLARMIVSLAEERWAAGRRISPEAWRCVARFVGDPAAGNAAAILEIALDAGPADRRGAALALWNTAGGAGRATVKAKAPELVAALEAGTITWDNYEP